MATSASTKLFAFAIPYVVVVAMLYLIGFWGPLGINPFEYIGLEHVALRTATPLIALVLAFLIGAGFNQLLVVRALPPGGGADTPLGRFGQRHWNLFLAIDLMLITATYLFVPEPIRWYVLILLLVPFSTALTHSDAIISLVPNPTLRTFLLFQLLAIPAFAFAQGRFEAYFVWRDSSRLVVDTSRSQLPLESDAKHPVIYLGRLGEYFVIGESKSKTLVVLHPKEHTGLYLYKP